LSTPVVHDAGMNYPRINQYRYQLRAGRKAIVAIVLGASAALIAGLAVVGAVLFALAGGYLSALAVLVCFGSIAALMFAGGFFLLAGAHDSLDLAGRYRIGADSEDYVAEVLQPLRREGWRGRASVDWPGPGDIDNAWVSPDGEVAFAIETKTLRFLAGALRRVYSQATWLCRRYRCRAGAVPVIVPARARDVERVEDGVLIVSPDRLLAAMRGAHTAACSARG